MSKNARNFILAILVMGMVFAYYCWKISPLLGTWPAAQPQNIPGAISPIPGVFSSSSSPHYPVPAEIKSGSGATSTSPALPTVDESDESVGNALINLLGRDAVESLINLRDLIRRTVITVENATQSRIPSDSFIFVQPKGQFRVRGGGDDLFISPTNQKRYKPYVSLVEKVDTTKLVTLYIHFYPLFQAAYRDLNPRGYFNDRLIESIDHALATPEVRDPIKLTSDSVNYKYADPQLEACSYSQKLLLRIGSVNAKIVKGKLREIRNSLTHFKG